MLGETESYRRLACVPSTYSHGLQRRTFFSRGDCVRMGPRYSAAMVRGVVRQPRPLGAASNRVTCRAVAAAAVAVCSMTLGACSLLTTVDGLSASDAGTDAQVSGNDQAAPADGDSSTVGDSSAARDATPNDAGRTDSGAADAGRTDAAVADAGPASSCADVLQRDPSRAGHDGIYVIVPTKNGPAFDVACDMTTAGGGWTLVGRSAASATTSAPFGWSTQTGDVNSAAAPYSLDVATVGLTFGEVLVASRVSDTSAVDAGFTFRVPADFMNHQTTSIATSDVTSVTAACTSPPVMLTYAGYVATNNHFYFRDYPADTDFGLFANGYNLNFADCRSGMLQATQGSIYVR